MPAFASLPRLFAAPSASPSRRCCWLLLLMLGCWLGVAKQVQAQPAGASAYQRQACAACHGERGQQPIGNGVPKLAGQNAAYLSEQLLAFRNLTRNSAASQAMWTHARRLSNTEIQQIASWLSAQKP